jgi:hypothetical protein
MKKAEIEYRNNRIRTKPDQKKIQSELSVGVFVKKQEA